jgi:hypothetical protein
LYITIGGTLVGNVATVILVGAAIALARVGKGPASGRLLSSLIAIVLGLALAAADIAVRRWRGSGLVPRVSAERRVLGVPRSWFGWYLVVAGWLFLLEGILIVVGVAAGVK